MVGDRRVVLITGGGRGIGAAAAKLFGRQGALVAVNYLRDANAAYNLVQEIQSRGGRGLAVRADVTDEKQAQYMVEKVEDSLGPIDTLILAAGISCTISPLHEIGWQDFHAKYTREIEAAWFPVRAVVPLMMERLEGCIVALSSTCARQPRIGYGALSIAKSAVESFIRNLALELGPYGIRANAIAIGHIETDGTDWMPVGMRTGIAEATPLRRIGTAEDVAGAILMLAGDSSHYITGACIPVSGGGLMI